MRGIEREHNKNPGPSHREYGNKRLARIDPLFLAARMLLPEGTTLPLSLYLCISLRCSLALSISTQSLFSLVAMFTKLQIREIGALATPLHTHSAPPPKR